ncbi:MAG: hypothetical protein PVH61_01950 [Candidatus Aminicenantes bacterium]|jgi:hypothetical protein
MKKAKYKKGVLLLLDVVNYTINRVLIKRKGAPGQGELTEVCHLFINMTS